MNMARLSKARLSKANHSTAVLVHMDIVMFELFHVYIGLSNYLLLQAEFEK